MAPAEARRMMGPDLLLGVSTHNVEQLRAALATGAPDYLAIGPVFATSSKENPDPVVGIEGVKAARALTRLPLVAIGGITDQNVREVMEAGADAVAVISALLPLPGREMAQRIRDFLAFFR
jgi:thiamine-phosphate pyrophosphorylase